MTALAFALALAAQQPAPATPAFALPWAGGRLYTSADVHVGLRPAFFADNENNGGWEVGVGATLQVTLNW